MTVEVAVMNRMAVALAADSAVTVTGGSADKIRNSAVKLFMLSKRHPVGVMVYNNASLLGVPWETIVKLFRQKLGDRSFETLETYGQELLSYLNGNQNLFPLELQKINYLRTLEAEYWKIEAAARKEVIARIRYEPPSGSRTGVECAESAIQSSVQFWRKQSTAVCFDESPSKEFVSNLSGEISERVNRVFLDWNIGNESTSLLWELAELLISRDYFPREGFSGVVIAGFGEKEHFPALQHFKVGGIYCDKLKFRLPTCEKIAEATPSIIKAFAYTEMVNSFLYGITSDVLEHLKEATLLIREMPVVAIDGIDDLSPEQQEHWKQKIRVVSAEQANKFSKKALLKCSQRYRKIMQAIDTLPLKELAQVASTLVSLSSFQQRMLPERETVGGPVDVAVISKGDGFIWIDRKHYFRRDLNHHFFENYFDNFPDEGEGQWENIEHASSEHR